MPRPVADPYLLDPQNVREPPRSFTATLRLIGPGLILASSIVGSGELIATTVLGAENGYLLLWLIIASCLIKTVVQEELGRHAIATGQTTLEIFDRAPGPGLKVSWLVWAWFVMVVLTLTQIGGMLGGISEILHGAMPAVPVNAWVWILVAATAVLLIVGRYRMIEKTAMALVVCFTVVTVMGAIILLKLPQYFSWADLLEGLSFQPPRGGLLTAVAAFGITGVGANELVMYPYWCIEKGYARYSGAREESPQWEARARGWTRVMGVDVANSAVIYTFATVAFYLLGAGVLHGMGLVPEGSQMVHVLSNLYTETLGPWSRPLFLVGAFAVLYSTVFSSTAAHCRVFADFAGMLGLYDRSRYALRLRATRLFAVILLCVPAACFLWLREPVLMVKIGGAAQASLLPVISCYTLYLRHKRMPLSIRPGPWVTFLLWLSAGLILVMMGYSILQRLMS